MTGMPFGISIREVFVLREMENRETADICKILEITVTNMGVLVHRARKRLRECIEAKGGAADDRLPKCR